MLLIEDDPDLQDLIRSYYEPRGFEVHAFSDPLIPLRDSHGPGGLNRYDVAVTDLRMPNIDGIEFIRKMKALDSTLPIILITAHSTVEIAIQAIETGAYDFVVKPIHFPQLTVSIERALRVRKLESDNNDLRSAVKSAGSFENVIGKSNAIQKVFDLAKRVSNSTATVMITGESGTGKEVIARGIHSSGSRGKNAFVAINCSAIPENLLESELFGHAKGAFTGAAEKKLGLFEEADGGTLFLDEIGDLNLTLQAKLLRVLQERKIKRIGENQFRPVDVRILAATHKDLEIEVREKRFREDLFFRLNVIPIKIPPLRERTDDILPLADHFLKKFRAQNDSPVRGFSRAALDHLLSLPWRGNVRELENAVERAVVLCTQATIEPGDLPRAGQGSLHISVEATPAEATPVKSPNLEPPLAVWQPEATAEVESAGLTTLPAAREFPELGALVSLEEFNLGYIDHVLKQVGGVKEKAARILDIDRKTLYRRIRELEARTP